MLTAELFPSTAGQAVEIALAQALGLVVLIYTFAKTSGMNVCKMHYAGNPKILGAYFNPAIVLGFFAIGKMAWLRGIMYILCQMAGALLRVSIARLAYPANCTRKL